MDLSKDNANKITCINESKVVNLPEGVFTQGDMLMLFNNSDDFITLQSEVKNTYLSARKEPRTVIEWPPRALVNIVFIKDDLAVVKVEI
jgi:hypothetical protein